MTDTVSNAVQREFIKWGFVCLIALVGAGFLSLANRNVYSKEQVDTKIDYVSKIQELQNDHTNEQLGLIRGDITEIKELVRESNQ